MKTSIKTFAVSALAALTLGGALVTASAPAQALTPKQKFGLAVTGAVVGGLALGAAMHGPAYGYGYAPVGYYPGCYWTKRPVFGPYGQVLYYRSVRVCG